MSIATCPLELRSGIEKCVPKYVTDARTSDGCYTGIIPQNVRLEKEFATWRLHTDNAIVVLSDLIESKISVDKITKFSVRPLELSHLFDQVGNYYRWFLSDPKILDREAIECNLSGDLYSSS